MTHIYLHARHAGKTAARDAHYAGVDAWKKAVLAKYPNATFQESGNACYAKAGGKIIESYSYATSVGTLDAQETYKGYLIANEGGVVTLSFKGKPWPGAGVTFKSVGEAKADIDGKWDPKGQPTGDADPSSSRYKLEKEYQELEAETKRLEDERDALDDRLSDGVGSSSEKNRINSRITQIDGHIRSLIARKNELRRKLSTTDSPPKLEQQPWTKMTEAEWKAKAEAAGHKTKPSHWGYTASREGYQSGEWTKAGVGWLTEDADPHIDQDSKTAYDGSGAGLGGELEEQYKGWTIKLITHVDGTKKYQAHNASGLVKGISSTRTSEEMKRKIDSLDSISRAIGDRGTQLHVHVRTKKG